MPNFIVKENEDFKDVNTADFYIEIVDSDYSGLCFVFGPIEFLGEDEEGNGRVKFDYHLLKTPEFAILEETGVVSEEHRLNIENIIGSVLHKILENMAQHENNTGVNSDETGNADPEQPTEG